MNEQPIKLKTNWASEEAGDSSLAMDVEEIQKWISVDREKAFSTMVYNMTVADVEEISFVCEKVAVELERQALAARALSDELLARMARSYIGDATPEEVEDVENDTQDRV